MLFPNKRKYIGIGQNELKNIGISDIGKNPISCIPNLIDIKLYFIAYFILVVVGIFIVTQYTFNFK